MSIIENEPIVVNDPMHNRYLSFAIADDIFAIKIRRVVEIVGIQPITKVPEVPEYIKGIINLRGKIVPVIDLRIKFKKDEIDYNERTCIIIVEISDVSVGFIVDKVEEVLTITEEATSPPPDYKSGIQNRYLSGVGVLENLIVLLIDCTKILDDDEFNDVTDIRNNIEK